MNKEPDNSSQIYTDFTISRIPPDIRQSLSDKQMTAIRNALLAQQESQRHSLDLRFSLPLFYRRYYFVLFCGRDRRRRTREIESIRYKLTPKPLTRLLLILSLGGVSAGLLVGLVIGLYFLKSMMGIDLFPDFHFYELFITGDSL
ncbi:MAG: hypothetical protein ACPGF7_00320 [Pontibacterium sp.]